MEAGALGFRNADYTQLFAQYFFVWPQMWLIPNAFTFDRFERSGLQR
jgi:hypothetical protein